ncbi:MAG: NAD/NADP octopine/nopaline dehydrogenase family protein [Rhizobiaceae bacterium]
MKIAVLGGGNGSLAAAGDLSLQGHEVRMWRREAGKAEAHRAHGNRIRVIDASGAHDAVLQLVSSDIAAVLEGAQLVICCTPAFSHDDIASAAAPHWHDGQVVFLPPGSFGSYIFAKRAYDAGNRSTVSFAETGTLPWLARLQDEFEVRISGRAVRLPTGVFPLSASSHALDIIGRAFPGVIEDCGDALSGALMNGGPIIHPPLIIMNAGPIEHFERWDIHDEGTQPSVRRVTTALDMERIAVREALGYGAPHFPLANHYAREGELWMYARDAHDHVVRSKDWNESLDLTRHRYMLEDTRIGLSLMASAGRRAGVATPIMDACLAIGSAIASQDFRKTGRTLENLGLAERSKDSFQALLREGFR